MTPEQLKASILQYAIQGKLVEQRPEEGNAEELYQQIQDEKQKLIKEGKIKKEKPLADITEDEISFDIPESWKWCYIGELFLHNTGKAQNSSGSTNGTIRKFITTSNLYWNEFDFTKVKEMPFTDKELERCTVKKGDLLVCEGGDCGRSAVWNYDEEVCIQNHVHRLRPYKELDIYYFYYLFYFYKNTGKLRGRGVAIQGLSNEAIHNVVVPLPPLEEQYRIVAKIEELLPFVDRYAASYEKLEQFNAKFPEDMKKSILQYAIRGKLVEQRREEGTAEELYQKIQEEKQKLIQEGKIKKEKPLAEITDDEIPFDIPESWKWVRVCSVGVTQTGNTPKKAHPEYFGNYIPFLGPGDIQNGNVNYDNQGLSEEGKEYGRVTPADSVLQVCIGGSIGKCALVDREVTFNQQINSIYPILSDSRFIYYVLDSYYFKDYMKENSGGTATPIINRGLWDAIVIPLPPLEEQHRIVAKIEELLPYCDQLVK